MSLNICVQCLNVADVYFDRVRERKYSFEEVTLKVTRLGKESLFQDPSGQQKETFTVTSTSGGSIAAGMTAGASGTVPTGSVSVNLVRDRQITISQQTSQWQLETYTSVYTCPRYLLKNIELNTKHRREWTLTSLEVESKQCS
jgi:hypothetical protein